MHFRFLPKHQDRRLARAQSEVEALKSVLGLVVESHNAVLGHYASKTKTQFGKGNVPWNKSKKDAAPIFNGTLLPTFSETTAAI